MKIRLPQWITQPFRKKVADSYCNMNNSMNECTTESTETSEEKLFVNNREKGTSDEDIVMNATNSEASEDYVKEESPYTTTSVIEPHTIANNETSEGIIPNPDVFLATHSKIGDGYLIGLSIRGRSHIAHETECQDYHAFEVLDSGWSILTVSDGAGSAKNASRGSKANSTFAIKLTKQLIIEKKWIENNYFPTELEWYIEARSIFERIKLIIRTKVSELEEQCTEADFNATILLTVITPFGILVAHIGDGRMGYLSQNNEWLPMMCPHKGAEANQTLFLQSSWTSPSVPALNFNGIYVPETKVISELPKVIIMMTDGCERSAWECSIMDNELKRYVDKNVPYPGFMNPLLDSLGSVIEEERMQLFIDIIDHGTSACEKEMDDKTMLLAVL